MQIPTLVARLFLVPPKPEKPALTCMNEHQHSTLVALEHAQAEVDQLRERLVAATAKLGSAREMHDLAIRRDPASWYGTPGTT
jgi:hypothetical protein